MKLAIFNCDARGMFQVHAAGCADCAKVKKSGKHNCGFPLDFNIEEHDSKLSVSRSIWSDMIAEGSMTAEDGLCEIEFAPCVNLPETSEKINTESKKVITVKDQRGLTICHLVNGLVRLDDEMREVWDGEFTSREQMFPKWDAERELYRITGEPGMKLPSDESKREEIRNRIADALRREEFPSL